MLVVVCTTTGRSLIMWDIEGRFDMFHRLPLMGVKLQLG